MDEYSQMLKNMDFEFFSTGKHKFMPEDFFNKENAVFLDVRTNEEVQTVNFKLKYHAIQLHIPLHELPERLDEIPKDKPVGVFCSGTQRASIAFGYLRGKGYSNVRILLATIGDLAGQLKPGMIRKFIK